MIMTHNEGRRSAKYDVCVDIMLTKGIPILGPNPNFLNYKVKFMVVYVWSVDYDGCCM